MLCGVWWPSWSTCSKQQQTCQFPLNRFFLPRVTAQVWHCRQRVRRFPKFLNRTESQMRHQEIRICYVEHDDQAEAPAASSSRLVNSHWIGFFYPASRHRCSTADKEYGVFPNSSTEQSCKWDSKKYGYVMWSMMTKLKHVQQAAADLSVPTEYAFFYTSGGTKFMLPWKPDKASISVNRGSHVQVHFVWQVWDGQLSPAF